MIDLEKVKKTLETLREVPADTHAAGPDVLALLTDLLLDHKSIQSPPHWFCYRADQITIDAATFLLRLHAYNSDTVQKWRQHLVKCLRGCCECVRGLTEAKISSRHTFFGAFPELTLTNFWADFESWELEMVRIALKDVLSNPSGRSLNDAPLPVVYHIFMNLNILLKPDILSIVHSSMPLTPTVTLPTDPIPPGILLLAFDEHDNSSTWARSQLKVSNILTSDQLIPPYFRVLESIVDAVSVKRGTGVPLSFSSNTSVLWSGVSHILRILPTEYFKTIKARQLAIHRLVFGHLHDHGPHFVDVLRSLVVLCKRMITDLWSDESTITDYPQVIFDAIKDNPTYTELLLNSNSGSWLLGWYMDYLDTIWHLPVLGNVVAKMADFMCEELQHERFQELRPSVMVAATRLLTSVDRKAREGGTPHQRGLSGNAIDIHCAIFISVAFDRAYSVDKWSDARKSARDIVKNVLTNDTRDVLDAIPRLSRQLAGRQETILVPSLRKQMWKETYMALQGNDMDGIAIVVSVVASSAHVDHLTPKAFRDLFKKADGHVAENVFKAINEALDVFHAGFLDAVAKFANCTTSSAIFDLLRRPGMMKDIMALMLSPVDEIQVAAQTLVGQAFDVDVRQECFRALLSNLPHPSLHGIFDFLGTFIQYASVVPEACSLSKSIVRCMTDIIEILCASSDGLLRSQTFTEKNNDEPGPAVELPKWWKLMTRTISVIFKRTPTWSLFFGNEEMVVWMRDALIFGRDMLAQRRVIESAAVTCSTESSVIKPGKLSRIGRRMVEDLKDVLPELGRWLRLTDQELLHQSFALLETLLACFKETQVPPPETGIAKLTKYIEDARKKDPKRPQSKLDSAHLAKLESLLAPFQNDSDDDVQIISHTMTRRKSDDVEIVDEPAMINLRKPAPPLEKDVKMRFKPSKPVAQSPTQATSKFFTTTDDKKRSTVLIPKALQGDHRSQTTSVKPSVPKFPSGKDRKGKTIATESSSSSDSESDERESGGEGGLASLAKLQRTPKIKRPAERRQVKMMNLPTNKNTAMERISRREDLRRTQLRLKPDISRFHRTLLSWDFDHSGSEPPYPGIKPQYLQIRDKFDDHDQYQRVFEPLLMMEAWAQVVKAKDEPGYSYPCTITSKQFVDDWLDLDIVINDQVAKDWMLMDTDVVLLRHLDGKKSVLAKTQVYRATLFGVSATFRTVVANRGDLGLQIGTTWKVSKVFSLSTLHREYATLVAVRYYDLFGMILRPRLTKKPYLDRKEIEQAMNKYGVNEPQAVAILASMRADGFTLIQGPPGTGKTSTICGLVQAYLSKRPRPTTAINVGRSAGPIDKSIPPKILLCAPSNAAIDEVAHRLRDGMLGSGKRGICPQVVRIGADNSVNIGVKDIALDFLVDQKLSTSSKSDNTLNQTTTEIAVIRKELDSVKKQRQEKQEELVRVQNNTARTLTLQEEIKKLNQRRMALTQQFDRLKDKKKSDSRTLDATRRKCRMEILQEADVICGTLSGSGHEALQLEQFDFEMIIIDEAAQAIELSSLIPLKYKCRRCIMVGDPQQLPPTVLSLEACKYQYNQSLFVRFQKDNPDAVHLLSIQYRMHPDISKLPSSVFYNGKLLDGPDMDVQTKQPWHSHEKFGPYKFFNVLRGREELRNSHSLINQAECEVAVALFNRLRTEFNTFDFDFRVGVISMYRAQIAELRRTFVRRFGQDIVGRVDFNTVDGFQGQEKDVIILSCVRAGPGLQSVGFLADTRRMNVALTRARSSLFTLGHVPTLERSDSHWHRIIQDARSRSVMIDVDTGYFTSRAADPVVRAPVRSVKPPTPTLVPPVPADLIKPRDIKPLSMRITSSQSTRGEEHPTGDIDLRMPATAPSHSGQQTSDGADDASQPPLVARRRIDGQGAKPKPRPQQPKRGKAGPSIFIPKKRPAPDGDPGKYPNKRR